MNDENIHALIARLAALEERVARLEQRQKLATTAPTGTPENTIRTRDKTRYLFNGHTYLKNRLVLEVVKQYILDHPDIDFDALQSVFCARIQGSFGVVIRAAEVKPKQQIRYFWKDQIQLKGESVAVSNQWTLSSASTFVALARSLGYDIQEV